MMYGAVKLTMIEYGDEKMIQLVIGGEQNQQITKIGNDHVLVDGMYLVHENGDY
jgi:hypothetical protein